MTGADDTRPIPAETALRVGPRSPARHVRLGAELDRGLRLENERTGAPASEVIRRARLAYLGQA